MCCFSETTWKCMLQTWHKSLLNLLFQWNRKTWHHVQIWCFSETTSKCALQTQSVWSEQTRVAKWMTFSRASPTARLTFFLSCSSWLCVSPGLLPSDIRTAHAACIEAPWLLARHHLLGNPGSPHRVSVHTINATWCVLVGRTTTTTNEIGRTTTNKITKAAKYQVTGWPWKLGRVLDTSAQIRDLA